MSDSSGTKYYNIECYNGGVFALDSNSEIDI
jgi:hypothetical protein